jgi:HJR/Mrr/RecB family endonuclease
MFRLAFRAVIWLALLAMALVVLVIQFAALHPAIAAFTGTAMIWFGFRVAKEMRKQREAKLGARMRDEHVPSMSPVEYEHFVARLLAQAGWNAMHCGQTGDQGCDVFAELRGFRAVCQVKHYRGRCPNSAVQEAVGARLHYRAQIMVVVAPNGFTRSAVELARSNGVHLLHHSALATLERAARIP